MMDEPETQERQFEDVMDEDPQDNSVSALAPPSPASTSSLPDVNVNSSNHARDLVKLFKQQCLLSRGTLYWQMKSLMLFKSVSNLQHCNKNRFLLL